MKYPNSHFPHFILFCFLLFTPICFSQNIQDDSKLSSRDDYSAAVVQCFVAQDWNKAREILDEGIDRYPKNSELRMLLGKYYYTKNDTDSARFELNKALEYDAKNFEAKHILINVEIGAQRFSSAICYINELLEVTPYDKDLWTKKIEIYRRQNNYVQANILLKRISQIYPDDSILQKNYVYALEQEVSTNKLGKEDESIELLSTLIKKDPSNEAYYLSIIGNYLQLGDYTNALSYADRGLAVLPDSMALINKKIDILNYLQRQNEALSFIQQKMKTTAHAAALQVRYQATMTQLAQYNRKQDPYEFYSTLFDKNPKDTEAFNYIVTTAITRGLYEDALVDIKKAKLALGETKDILVKEYAVYASMGAESKVIQMTDKLYKQYPNDEEVREHYFAYQLKLVKNFMQEEQYSQALPYWKLIADEGTPELKKTALLGTFNCLFQLKNNKEALETINALIEEYPQDADLKIKKAMVLGEQQQFLESLKVYQQGIILTPPTGLNLALGGYDEQAAKYTKVLMENYQYSDALPIIEQWLKMDPQSQIGMQNAINCSMALNDDDHTLKYIQQGLKNNPDDRYCYTKLSEFYNLHQEYKKSLELLYPVLLKNPYNKDLIAIYSEASANFATRLLKTLQPDSCLRVLQRALIFAPNDKQLKYVKGKALEKKLQYKSAYYYQSFYDPTPLEAHDFENHLSYLKSKTYQNNLGLYLMRTRFSESTSDINYIQGVDYVHVDGKDTYTGAAYYTGRDVGKAVQVQLNYTRQLESTWRASVQASVSNKIFPSFSFSASAVKLLRQDWELEGGLGYKNLNDSTHLFSLQTGVTKEWNVIRWNARLSNFLINSKWYYNVSSQIRLYVDDSRDYIIGMASIGSAPDVELVENQLYNIFTVQNTMMGLGGFYTLNDRLSLGLVGAWYNYEAIPNLYRNLYNLNLEFHVRF